MPYFIGFPIEELNPGCATRDATNQKVNGFAVHDQRQNITTYEMKNGFLLIEVLSKLFNLQNYGHQGYCLGGLFL
jgi:hypothetical protein